MFSIKRRSLSVESKITGKRDQPKETFKLILLSRNLFLNSCCMVLFVNEQQH